MHCEEVQPRAKRVARLLALTALAFPALVCPIQARAQDDTNTFNSLLGFFGMQFDKEDAHIDYRARPPLVVPPRNDLPPPKEAKRDPNWPDDPDVMARRRAALDSKRPAPQDFLNKRAELSPQEAAGRKAQTSQAKAKGEEEDESRCLLNGPASGEHSCLYAPWKLLQTVFGGEASDKVEPGVEPPRRYLTEPPAGYRSATAATTATNDAPREQPDAADPGAYIRAGGRP
jgi:hypothetical protein